MQWEAKGVNRETGADEVILIEADNEASAQRRANRRGLMVESVRPLDPNDSVADALADLATASTATVVPTRRAVPPPQPAYTGAPPQQFQPTYNQQAVSVHVHQQRGTSGWGIAALVLGIIALLFCWVPFVGLLSMPIAAIGALLAIVGAIVSLAGGRSGIGMPMAGLLICILSIGVAVFSSGATAVAITGAAAKAGDISLRVKSQSNLSMIGKALLLYADENGGRAPNSLDELVSSQGLPANALRCPIPGTTYVYRKIGNLADSNMLVCYEQGNDGLVNMLFASGEAESFTPTEAKQIIATGRRSRSPSVN